MQNATNDMRTSVGMVAGDIFRWLETHSNTGDLNTLRKEMPHLDERLVLQGMGWLMREGKLQVLPQVSGNTTNYSLQLHR